MRIVETEFYSGRDSWIVHIGFVKHQSDVDATIDLAIRFEAVERALVAIGFARPGGATVGAELGNIVDGRPRRGTLEDVSEAPVVAKGMTAEVEKFAMPWFARHMVLDQLLTLLLQNDQESWLVSPHHVKRWLSAVALAMHLGTAGRAVKVAKGARAFLESRRDPQLEEFDRYVGLLLTA
jgi:hypothetical protein